MKVGGFEVRLPTEGARGLAQDEEYCVLVRAGEERTIRFHDYHEVYSVPGLYEYLFYDRLACTSHREVSGLLVDAVMEAGTAPAALRVLELGAGNGLVGEALADRGVGTLVGADILEAAAAAAERDRPELYDRYYVEDFSALAPGVRQGIASLDLNCMVCVAALGFGDIPPDAFVQAFNLVEDGGWVAFNIKEDFIDDGDSTGFGHLIKQLVVDGTFEVVDARVYQHRLAVDGQPLSYVATVGRKRADISVESVPGVPDGTVEVLA
jgi:SAM-dependent methyltransferase